MQGFFPGGRDWGSPPAQWEKVGNLGGQEMLVFGGKLCRFVHKNILTVFKFEGLLAVKKKKKYPIQSGHISTDVVR